MPAHLAEEPPPGRSRLVIVLGAGASADVVPTTVTLTKCAQEREDRLVAAIACHERIHHPNLTFEDVLEAGRRRLRLDHRPAPDGDLGTSLENYFRDVVRQITSCVQAHEASGAVAAQVPLLKALAKSFYVTVASLNWDDLAWDPLDPWYCGFRAGRFDDDYVRYASDPQAHRILWLHGSVHFRVQMDNCVPTMEWMSERQQIAHATLLPQDDRGFAGPLITGRAKDRQLWRTPFVDYRYTLYRDLLRASAVLVVGYSGNDHDLNDILHAAVSVGAPKVLMRIDHTDEGKFLTVAQELEWWNRVAGHAVRNTVPVDGARRIRPADGLVSVTDPGRVAGFSPFSQYLSLGGCQWMAAHSDEVMAALTGSV